MKLIRKISITLSIGFFLNCFGSYSTSPHFSLFVFNADHHVKNPPEFSIGQGKVMKRGESCVTGFLIVNTLFYSRGPSLAKAMESAGIKKIAVIDRKTTQILPIYSIYGEDCIVVWGE